MSSKIRIKDIAEMAGVSVGTVDRVLHGRPNISKIAREKVWKFHERRSILWTVSKRGTAVRYL